MKNPIIIFIAALLWHLLIWEAGAGINILLFCGLITTGIYLLKPAVFARREVKYLLSGWGLASLFVVIHHSDLSIFVFWLFSFVCIGYLQRNRVQFWMVGIIESIRALFAGWVIGGIHFYTNSPKTQITRFIKRSQLFLIPIAIFIPFYLIYSNANNDLGLFNEWLNKHLANLFTFDIDGSRIFVFFLGWAFMLAFLGTRNGIQILQKITSDWSFSLNRKRRLNANGFKTMALKAEYQTAIISFVALNVLLLIVNILDIKQVWLPQPERSASELSQFVHEGTWLLILSIFMAMVVVAGFLRDKLNFFPNNSQLIRLVYLWLGQNLFLALSVGIRNGHYIHAHGLAQGRIVVMFFLVLVFFCLWTMYTKVKVPKTTFYLLQYNAIAVLGILLFCASVNWDSLITHYNLHLNKIDSYQLTHKLENNLVPLLSELSENPNLQQQIKVDSTSFRIRNLQHKQDKPDWRNWNLSEYRQYKAWLSYQAQLQE